MNKSIAKHHWFLLQISLISDSQFSVSLLFSGDSCCWVSHPYIIPICVVDVRFLSFDFILNTIFIVQCVFTLVPPHLQACMQMLIELISWQITFYTIPNSIVLIDFATIYRWHFCWDIQSNLVLHSFYFFFLWNYRLYFQALVSGIFPLYFSNQYMKRFRRCEEDKLNHSRQCIIQKIDT